MEIFKGGSLPLSQYIHPFLQGYSNCVTHLVNPERNLDYSTVQTPVIASNLPENSTTEDRVYEKSFFGVRTFKCLLTILFTCQNYSASAFSSALLFILPKFSSEPNRRSVQIYPQTVIIFAASQLVELANDVKFELGDHYNLYFLPEIFILRHSHKADNIWGLFLCWYCGSSPNQFFLVTSIEFSCFGGTHSCKADMEKVVEENAKNGAASMWKSPYPFSEGPVEVTTQANPFDRSNPSSLSNAVASFVLDFNGTWHNHVDANGERFPQFAEATPEVMIAFESCKVTLLHTGMTSRIKFITNSQVRTPKSSYTVYFTPFSWLVWTGMGAYAVISFLIAFTATALPNQKSFISIGPAIWELVTWKFSSLFGHYKHSSVPIVVPSQRPSVVLNTTVILWLTVTAMVLNVYQAAFSSDSALVFPFFTTWKYFTQLENFTLYLLVSNSLCSQYMSQRNGRPITNHRECFSNNLLFAECRFLNKLRFTVGQEVLYGSDVNLVHSLTRMMKNSSLLCNSEDKIRNRSYIGKEGTEGIAFLTYEYDFSQNWDKFSKLMETNASLKYAHNMDEDDDFGVTFQGYVFTDGLHPRFSTRGVIGRFKRLISSGIYDLWERWDRIRFSQRGRKIGNGFTRSKAILSLPKPLSFDNSGTPWLFQAQFVAWFIAMVVFVIEMGYVEYTLTMFVNIVGITARGMKNSFIYCWVWIRKTYLKAKEMRCKYSYGGKF